MADNVRFAAELQKFKCLLLEKVVDHVPTLQEASHMVTGSEMPLQWAHKEDCLHECKECGSRLDQLEDMFSEMLSKESFSEFAGMVNMEYIFAATIKDEPATSAIINNGSSANVC